MPTLPRLAVSHTRSFTCASIPQHVIQRGEICQACFYADDDQRFYLECLGQAAGKYRVSIHAYVLMTPTSATGIGRVSDVRYINQTYRRSGTLREGRNRLLQVAVRKVHRKPRWLPWTLRLIAQKKTWTLSWKPSRRRSDQCALKECSTGRKSDLARIKHEAEIKGTPLDENDLWLASIAAISGSVLVTSDKDFRKVRGLSIEDWTQ